MDDQRRTFAAPLMRGYQRLDFIELRARTRAHAESLGTVTDAPVSVRSKTNWTEVMFLVSMPRNALVGMRTVAVTLMQVSPSPGGEVERVGVTAGADGCASSAIVLQHDAQIATRRVPGVGVVRADAELHVAEATRVAEARGHLVGEHGAGLVPGELQARIGVPRATLPQAALTTAAKRGRGEVIQTDDTGDVVAPQLEQDRVDGVDGLEVITNLALRLSVKVERTMRNLPLL
jgi:hypothetical protein